MRRRWIILGTILAIAATVAVAYRGFHWMVYRYAGTRLMVDLAHPDAVIKTASLSALPRDLLKAPIARDVLTEDMVFYYEQHEDRLGLQGAIKRIAYEHELEWTDRILASVLDEPAELALWRDGKGALRHYALVIRRNTLSKVIQQAATVAAKDSQLKLAGEIDTGKGNANVYALEVNPRRVFLIIAEGDRLVVLSDPGLLFNKGNKVVADARAAVVEWLNQDSVLSKAFGIENSGSAKSNTRHTLAVGAPAMALGYSSFIPGFKGLKLDFDNQWSTSLLLSPEALPKDGVADARLWRVAPANPSACVMGPVDWNSLQSVIKQANNKPALPEPMFAALTGPALACWYRESSLFSPVFIARLPASVPQRDAALATLFSWAMPKAAKEAKETDEGNQPEGPVLMAKGDYVFFSPDRALASLVADTIARTNPSVADEMPAANATVAVVTPQAISAMFEKEALAALSDSSDSNLLAVVKAKLPARMKALGSYPPTRLDLTRGTTSGWQRVEWHTSKERK